MIAGPSSAPWRPGRAIARLTAAVGVLAIAATGAARASAAATAAQASAAAVAAEAKAVAPEAPATSPQPIRINTANWSANAGFGSRHPAWYKDRSGVVHLQGAVHQTSAAGTGASLIGTLPPAARPARTVYTIVHTYLGTYADLAIEPNGKIALISPRPPLVTDFNFVSLEGISYRR